MALRKPRAKRLKISTGDDRESGAKPGYVRKLNRQDVQGMAKTAEETLLESQLFGRGVGAEEEIEEEQHDMQEGPSDWLSSLRSNKLREEGNLQDLQEGQEDGDEAEGKADDQLFFTDAPGPLRSGPNEEDSEQEEDEDEEDEDDDDEDSSGAEEPARKTANSHAPLWFDPADEHLTVSLQDSNRLRKLRSNASEDVVSGTEYEVKLRNQFRKIHPTPAWAIKARQKSDPDATAEVDGSEEADQDGETEMDNASLAKILRTSNAGLNRSRRSKAPLPGGELEITRLRDANQVDKTKSGITALQFHPSSTSQVLFTTSEDRRLKLYQIDGTHNPLLQSVHMPELPITSASFHPSGNSVLMTGQRPFFFCYDLQAGRVIRSPRGLWSSGLGGSDSKNDQHGGSMELFKFSPDGKMVAVAGRRGYIHLLDWGNGSSMAGGNGGQVIGEIKINTGIKGLSWNNSGSELVTVGHDAMVQSWDIGTRRCVSRWQDEGGYAPTCISSDRAEKYFAIGSRSGIINIYDSPSVFTPSSSSSTSSPKPLKSIMNLTTSVSHMRFNHSSEILSISSSDKKDSLKLVHLPTMSIFQNWPTSGTPLGHVNTMDFSRGSEYAAIAGKKGRVLLYTLGHYAK